MDKSTNIMMNSIEFFKLPLSEMQNSAHLVIKTKDKRCTDARLKNASVSPLITMSDCPHDLSCLSPVT